MNTSKTPTRPQGKWLHRLAIRLFTVVLAVLVYWVLGFVVDDIRAIDGPDYEAVEARHLDAGLLARQDALGGELADLQAQIRHQSEKQRIVRDSAASLQQTMNQLLELQRLSLEKDQGVAEAGQDNIRNSLNLFLEQQKSYQNLSQELADLLERQQGLQQEQARLEQTLQRQREPAQAEYAALMQTHRFRLALWQLGILLPVLAVAAVLLVRQRGSLYFPLLLAWGGATLLKVAMVAHEYFPSRYFKYLLIGGLLLAVARLLVYFIRAVAFPQARTLLNQYREAYERFLCPVCEYPIRTGPRRFLFWSRRTVHKVAVPCDGMHHAQEGEGHSCPACGTTLFEPCPVCHKSRHAMLPYCEHCGAEKTVV